MAANRFPDKCGDFPSPLIIMLTSEREHVCSPLDTNGLVSLIAFFFFWLILPNQALESWRKSKTALPQHEIKNNVIDVNVHHVTAKLSNVLRGQN